MQIQLLGFSYMNSSTIIISNYHCLMIAVNSNLLMQHCSEILKLTIIKNDIAFAHIILYTDAIVSAYGVSMDYEGII